jgi:hypothetical protein
MLDPDLVSNAVVQALQSIPVFNSIMTTDAETTNSNIYSFYYQYGQEQSLARAIFQMKSPSCLVAYKDYLGGNFNQMTLWKHRLEICIRPPNAAVPVPSIDPTNTLLTGMSTPHLSWLMMNSPIVAPTPFDNPGPIPSSYTANIRQVRLLSGLLLMDTPTLTHRQDESLSDFFMWSVIIPEIGDE